MFNKFLFAAAVFFAGILCACSNWLENADSVSDNGSNLYVAVQMEAVNSGRGLRATAHTKLLLRVLDDKNAVIKDTTITNSGGLIMCGLGKLTAEKNYRIIAWTEDAVGDIIHSPDTQTVYIEANNTKSVAIILSPRIGSIVTNFMAVPSTVDSFFMVFDSDSGKFETKVARSVNISLSLDKIPYGAQGKLSIEATLKSDNSSYLKWDTLFTFRKEHVSLEISFLNNGTGDISIIVTTPYSTIITAFGDIKLALGEEKNIGVLITEFSVNTSNADFVEIANLSDKTVSFDELRIEVIGSNTLRHREYGIVIDSRETFVFTSPALVNTSAIILIYGDDVLIDYVAYFNDNTSGWPKITGTSVARSWVLKDLVADPKYNNFPYNWQISIDCTPGEL